MSADQPSTLVSVRIAAAYLGIKEDTLRHWLSDRRLPFTKIGGRTLLKRKDLDAYIEAQTIPAEAPEPASLTRRRKRPLSKPPA